MNAEFLAVLEYWEKEKGITKDVLLNAVQESLLAAAKKAVGPARELRVAIDPKSGDIKAWARLVVTERVVSTHAAPSSRMPRSGMRSTSRSPRPGLVASPRNTPSRR